MIAWLTSTMVLLSLVQVLVLMYLCIRCFRRYKSKFTSPKQENIQSAMKHLKIMPRPPSLPIIGHIHLLRDYKHNPWDGFQAIREKFGPIVSLKMGIHQMILVSSDEAIREILLKKGDTFSDRPNFSRHHIIFGGDKENSLALCNWTNTHRDRRKLCKRGIAPNKFSSRNQLLEKLVCTVVGEFIKIITSQKPIYSSIPTSKDYILNTNQNETQQTASSPITSLVKKFYYIATKEHILYLTSDIFMEFLCNKRVPHSDPEYRDFVLGCDFVFWDINQMYLIDFLPFLTSLGLGFTYLRKLKRVTDFLRGYIDEKIFEPRCKKIEEQLEKCKKEGLEKNDEESSDYLDSLILEYLSNETSMLLADYKVGFADLLAGHAAVSNILMRLLGHLALDQKFQDMICDEANQVEIHNLKHTPSLPVTEAALQEALRLASSPIVPHVARDDTTINQYYVTKGSMVLFNNYYLNLSESFWQNPYEFNPLRFLEIHETNSNQKEFKLNIPKHFIPFSVGMRQCLGYKMVETSTIVTIANICRRFVIRANDEQLVRMLLSPKGSVALNPDASCFELRLHPRGEY